MSNASLNRDRSIYNSEIGEKDRFQINNKNNFEIQNMEYSIIIADLYHKTYEMKYH